MSRTRIRLALTAAVVVALGAVACGASAPAPTSTPTAMDGPDPTAIPGLVEGEVGDGRVMHSADGRLEVASAGLQRVGVSMGALDPAPEAPAGWTLLSAVYDIDVHDGQRRVTRLDPPLLLRFAVDDGPATLLRYDGVGWSLASSDQHEDGMVEAEVHRPSAFAVGRPASIAGGSRGVLPSGALPAPETLPPDFSRGMQPPTGFMATPPEDAPAEVSPEEARTALESEVARVRGGGRRIAAATGLRRAGNISLPSQVATGLDAALETNGTLYHGFYGGVSQAIRGLADAGAGGGMTLLVEPGTTMPASPDEARGWLEALFPGLAGPRYTLASQGPAGYVFAAVDRGHAYVLGFILVDGLPVAFAAEGSGSYYGAVLTMRTLP